MTARERQLSKEAFREIVMQTESIADEESQSNKPCPDMGDTHKYRYI